MITVGDKIDSNDPRAWPPVGPQKMFILTIPSSPWASVGWGDLRKKSLASKLSVSFP